MRRRSLVVLAVLVTALALAPAAMAAPGSSGADGQLVRKGEFNSYVVIMKADPLVATFDRDRLGSAPARFRARQLTATHDATLREAGVSLNRKTYDYTGALNGFAARINYQQARQIAADKDVEMVLPDELRQPLTDESGEFLGLTGGSGAWNSGVTGKGVVVGIIDTGIWPEHSSFADNGLPAPTGVAAGIPCQFGNTAHNPNDAPFTCQNKLIGARAFLTAYKANIGLGPDEFDSARDDSGHGTHTSSTAAGNAGVQAFVYGSPVGDGTISGIAPDAHIIAYKGLGNGGGFTSDLAAAITQAVNDGVDVINYSIGGGGGVIGADELAFRGASLAGVFVANSAGNSGPGARTLGAPADVPWVTAVGANTQRRFIEGTVRLGNGRSFRGASITDDTNGSFPLVDAATLGNEFCESSKTFSTPITGKIVLCKRGVNARVDKGLAVLNGGGVGMVHFEASDQGNLFTDTHWVPTVHIDNTPGLAIKAYIASAGAGATARIQNTRRNSTWRNAPTMTQFSSRGPNNYPDIIKPDITAPGLQILAGNSPFPDAGSVTGELFQAIAGTSMSSPHVAGLYALLKQVNPGWSAAAAKSALMTTADQDVRDNDRTSRADPFDMGSGHADIGRPGRRGSAFQPGAVYNITKIEEYRAWMCGAAPASISPTTCATLATAGYSLDPSNLNYPSIAVAELTGSQTVPRTLTSVASETVTWRVRVNEPAGYDMEVSPSTITLAPGASATFEVDILNVSAPIGEWRFGALTWRSTGGDDDDDGRYSIRSPIAVNGRQLDAAKQVNGEGESGSASFDVKFGYTGEYDATAHGLVPATVTHDNVIQDVEPSGSPVFTPSDVGNGANLHTFALSGAAHFRVALPAAATEAGADLDVYVYNPSDVRVASSTGGSGSDELIDIDSPVDGTWKVYVHGWATPGGDSDYDLFTWAISATPGGNLSIDSEPADAVSGATGTINVSWTGATAGQWHLGAVSHVGPGGAVIARTLVNVDNLP